VKAYIGIDDTDNLDTRGTGHQARMLGKSLQDAGLLQLHSITRHQLLVDRRIPFTSHNSSACLVGESSADTASLAEFCKDFLIRESAFDADAGLCIAFDHQLSDGISKYGYRAKKEIITLDEAQNLAEKSKVYLDGFLNTRCGMIGALAAVGLRAAGNDGRLLWALNLRETEGIFTAGEYLEATGVERIIGKDEAFIPPGATLKITDWCRPVMKNGYISLIVDRTDENKDYEYISASKDYIKSISE
jgi:hypothetical protein